MVGHVHSYEAGAAAHAAEIESLDALFHLVALHDPRSERRRGAESGDIDDENVDLPMLDASLG